MRVYTFEMAISVFFVHHHAQAHTSIDIFFSNGTAIARVISYPSALEE